MTLHTQILQEFLNSNIKIISLDKLKEYINFCIDKNQLKRIKGKTSYHHILPNALFSEYSNLKNNPWNGSYLMYSDHYYAHWLITEAINDYGQLFAFCKMHNCDIELGRIRECDLITNNKFQEKMEDRKHKQHQWCENNQEKVAITINKHKKTINSKEWKETVGKESTLKRLETINSKEWKETVGTLKNISHSNTLNSKEWKESKGIIKSKKISTKFNSKEWKETKGKEAAAKRHNTVNSKEWKETVGKEAKRKAIETKNSNSIKKFGIYDVYINTTKIYTNLTKNKVLEIQSSLFKTTATFPLGYTRMSKLGLNRTKKLNLMGAYVIKVK